MVKPPPLPAHWLTIEDAAEAIGAPPSRLELLCSRSQLGYVVHRWALVRLRSLMPVACVREHAMVRLLGRSTGRVRCGQPASGGGRVLTALSTDWPHQRLLRPPGPGWRTGRRPELYYRPRAGSTLSVAAALAPLVPVGLPRLPAIRARYRPGGSVEAPDGGAGPAERLRRGGGHQP